MKKIYIIGAGGFGREVAWLIERINHNHKEWDIQGFLDDNNEKHGQPEGHYRVLGGCDILKECKEEVWAVCAVGSAHVRKKIINRVMQYENVKFATLIDPSVLYSDSVKIGEGTIVCAGCILTVDISIGRHVLINLDCTVGHDAVLEDFVTVYPSVNISGCATVEQEVELWTGAQIIQGKRIGYETIVGAGAVVDKDLPCKCTAVGAPAQPVKYKE